jgi:hypothetical protein
MTDVVSTQLTATVTVATPTSATVSTSGTDTAVVDVSTFAPLPSAIRYTADFTATGLTFTGTGTNAPGYNSYYVKNGQIVTFYIEIHCSTVTNFGTGQMKTKLPFTPLMGGNHFAGWIWRDPAIPADDANHIILNVDHNGITDVLDMHFLVGAPAEPKPVIENQLKQGAPGYNLTTVSRLYVSGTYISQE